MMNTPIMPASAWETTWQWNSHRPGLVKANRIMAAAPGTRGRRLAGQIRPGIACSEMWLTLWAWKLWIALPMLMTLTRISSPVLALMAGAGLLGWGGTAPDA